MTIHSLLEKKQIVSSALVTSMAAMFLLVGPAQALASVGVVQDLPFVNGSGNCVSPSTFDFHYTSNVTSGNLLVVTLVYKGSGTDISQQSPPTDTLGNTWTLINNDFVNSGSNSSRSIAAYYAIANSSGADAVTVACPPDQGNSSEFPNAYLHEFSGENTTTPVLTSSVGHGSSLTASTGNVGLNTGLWFQMDVMSVNNIGTPTYATGFTADLWSHSPTLGTVGGTHRVIQSGDSNTAYGQITFPGSTNFQWDALSYQIQ